MYNSDLRKIESCLSPRLLMVASLVPPSSSICDIGTDHGYVAIYLAIKNPCSKVIAADLRKGPLCAAEKNVKEFNMEHRVSLRLSDGFSEIACGEADTAIIAGMGGETIAEILQTDRNTEYFILQPQSAHYELRKYLCENGYTFIKEEICREGNKMYTAMLVRRDAAASVCCSLNKAELEIGPILLKESHPLLNEYIDYRLYEVNSVLEKLKAAPSASERTAEYTALRDLYLSLKTD